MALVNGPARVDLTWTDNANNETGFRIERSPQGSGVFVQVGVTAVNAETFVDSSVGPATAYEYRVFAFNGQGDSSPATATSGLTPDDHGNDAPTATPATLWLANAGVIEASGDQDWFSITLSQGVDYTLRTITAGDTQLALYNDLGQLLASNDDENQPLGLLNSRLQFQPTATATYYLAVTGTGGISYDLHIVIDPPPLPGTVAFFGELFPTQSESVIWVLDHSGSMGIGAPPFIDHTGTPVTNGSRLDRVKSETIIAINALPASTVFNVVKYDECATVMWPTRRPATAANKLLATQWLEAITQSGWTNTSLGASEALAETNNRTLIVVSDGAPNFIDCAMNYVGSTQTHLDLINQANLQLATIHSVGIELQSDPDARAFMQQVAIDSGGIYYEPNLAAPQAPPDAPSGLTGFASGSAQVDLTWIDNSFDETEFRIERSPTGMGSYGLIAVVPADTTVYSDTSTLGGSDYDYRVLAVNQGTASAPSNTFSVSTPPIAIGTPSGLVAVVVSPIQVDLSWVDNAAGETGYRIQRSLLGAGAFTDVGTAAADATAFTDLSADPATAYDYRVRAFNALGNSSPSNVASATTPAPPLPAAPTGLVAGAPNHVRVDLVWVDNSIYESGFRIERAPAGSGSFVPVATAFRDQVSYSDTSVAPGTAYDYIVYAINVTGDSPPSNIASVTVPLTPPPLDPSGLSAVAAGPTQVDLTWTDNSNDELEFRIERSPAGLATYAPVGTSPADTPTFSDLAASPATSYDYRVVAVGTSSDSAPSNVASATTPPTPPTAPSTLVAVPASPFQVDLTWTDNATNETGFRVERSPQGAGTFASAGTAPADATAFSDTTAAPATAYDYRVIATNSGGDSLPSNTAGASTPPVPLPQAPTALATTSVNGTQVVLSWIDNATYETGFRVERRLLAGTFAAVGTPAADVTDFTDLTVSPNTTYEFRVYATNSTGDSPPSNVIQVVTPAAPTLATISTASGPLKGGTPLTLTGTGFMVNNPGPTAVTLNGITATNVLVVSDVTITAETPRGLAPGDVDVTVSNLNGTASLPGAFHYINHALSFDGGDAVDLVHNSSYDLGTTLTFECWLKLNTHNTSKIFSKWRVAVEDKNLSLSSGRVNPYFAGPNGGLTAVDPVPLGRWVHIAVSMDATGTRIYLNGKLNASSSLAGDMKDSTGTPRIGIYFRDGINHPSFDGLVDEFRLSRVARYTTDFVPQVRLTEDANTVLMLHFDEGEGTTTADASPNSNQATLAAAPAEPQWVTEDIVLPDAELQATMVLASDTVIAGATGFPVQVTLDNTGTEAATIQAAQLQFADPGFTPTRTDSVTSVPAGGSANLTFLVDVSASVPPGRSSVDVTVQAIDAGNGIDISLPRATAPATFQVIGWFELGTSATAGGISDTQATASATPTLALEDSGDPVVAWAEGSPGEIYLERWTGAAWEELAGSASGAGISANVGASVAPQVALGATEEPVVAWQDDSSGVNEIYLRSWNGTAWQELAGSSSAGGLSNTASASTSPALAMAGANPIVAWQEDVGGNQEIYLRSWNGTAWVELGGSASGGGVSGTSGASTLPALGLTPTGNPIVAWLDTTAGTANVYLRAWDGAAWQELAGSGSAGGVTATTGLVSSVDLQVSRTGEPSVAWADDLSGASEIYVRSWNGTAWVELGGSGSGTGLSATGDPSRFPSLALDAAGRPLVAWQEEPSSAPWQIFLARWDGVGWIECAGSLSSDGLSETTGASLRPSLALERTGQPVVAWEDMTRNAAAGEVYVERCREAFLVLFEDFNDGSFTNHFVLNGHAVHNSSSVRLTTTQFDQAGSVFYQRLLNLDSFRATFTLRAGEADGITLAMIQGAGPALVGAPGGGMGVRGLDGYAVEFDPWPNGADISHNHVSFSEALNLTPLTQTNLLPGPLLETASFLAEVVFDNGHLELYLESPGLAYPRTKVIDYTLPSFSGFEGYLGLTGGTGAVYDNQWVDDFLIVVD